MTQTSHHPSATAARPAAGHARPEQARGRHRRRRGRRRRAADRLWRRVDRDGTRPARDGRPGSRRAHGRLVGRRLSRRFAGADALATTSSIPVGGGTVFADKDVVVTQPTAGEFKAFSATCTHQGCKVKSVADGVIVCPCHGSKFAIADGAVTAGPAKSPLPEKSVSVEGDSIVLA